jgi:hypothetical protein
VNRTRWVVATMERKRCALDRPRWLAQAMQRSASMMTTTRYAPDILAKLRHHLMSRGMTLSTILSELLAGKRPPELTALVTAKPGKRPEEVVREALDQVERRRKLLDAGDDRFGRCDVCGVDLGRPALDEMPWADRCVAHATAAAAD